MDVVTTPVTIVDGSPALNVSTSSSAPVDADIRLHAVDDLLRRYGAGGRRQPPLEDEWADGRARRGQRHEVASRDVPHIAPGCEEKRRICTRLARSSLGCAALSA
jgi:hypothetical protein